MVAVLNKIPNFFKLRIKKGEAPPVEAYYRPRKFQEVEAPRF